MAKVEENAKEQKKEDFFCKLVIVLFDTYKIVIHHVLKCNWKCQQELKSVFILIPILRNTMFLSFCMVVLNDGFWILKTELINDERDRDGEKTNEKRVREELVFVDCLSLGAVVDQLIVSFGESDDKGVEGE